MIDLLLQTPADSTAAVVGGAAGAFVTAKIALGIGVVTKFVMDLAMKVGNMASKLPTIAKPFVALAVAFALNFVNAKLAILGGPELTGFEIIPNLLAWGVAMGFHSLVTAVMPSK